MKKILLLCCAVACALPLCAQWQAHTPALPLPTSCFDVYGVDENVAWAVMMRARVDSFSYGPLGGVKTGYILRTKDGGRTWQYSSVETESQSYISNVCALDARRAWASGSDLNTGKNFIIQTVDSGKVWTPLLEQGLNTNGSFVDAVHFWNEQEGLVFGDPSTSSTSSTKYFEIWRTTNGGLTWQRLPRTSPPTALNGEEGIAGVYEVVGSHIFFPTVADRLLKSTDRGATWRVIGLPTGAATSGLSFADSLHGVLGNYSGKRFTIGVTTDGGLNWADRRPTDNRGLLTSVAMVPKSRYIVAVVRDNNIRGPFRTLLSRDLGLTWQVIGQGEHAAHLDFVSPNAGYGGELQPVGRLSKMYRYAGDPLTGLFTPDRLDAEVQLFPNPTADVLHVNIRFATAQPLLILLNDRNGRLLEQQRVDQTAEWSGDFPLQHLPAGQYVLTISSPGGNLSKMVTKH